jgi:pre-mRNA-splicing factor 18
MDKLRKEMERKRKVMALAKQKASDAATEAGDGKGGTMTKYVRASDVRRLEDELRYNTKHQQQEVINIDVSAESAGSKKRPRLSSSKESEDKGQVVAAQTESSVVDGNANEKEIKNTSKDENGDTPASSMHHNQVTLSEEEITHQLRELGLPIKLFGESRDPHLRTRRLQIAQRASRQTKADRREGDEFKLQANTGHNIRNTFLQRQNSDNDPFNSAPLTKKTIKSDQTDRDGKPIIDNEQEREQPVSKDSHEQEGDPEDEDDHKRVHSFFKSLLKQWESYLIARPLSKKQTLAGKNELKTYKQCKDYVRPLFRLLKNRLVEDRILAFLVEIVTYCKQGEFVKANDSYMDLAIGRAAWPIGVTMVGIHARSGREKIGSNNVAHVMNSELQRKYLTSVKRLMTFAQTLRDDVDPSKKVW